MEVLVDLFGDLSPSHCSHFLCSCTRLSQVIICTLIISYKCPYHNSKIFCSGYLGPGGLHKNRTYENCIGGATGYIDKLLLGSHNIYQYPTIYEVYEARPFDPEGVVGMSPKS